MKKLCLALVALTASALMQAQTITVNTLIESRADATFTTDDNALNIKHVNTSVSANIADKFEFYWRIRNVNWAKGVSFIDASDFLYIGWKPTDFLRLRAGKGCLYIGGYEYEQGPIDIFYMSDFCSNVAPYKYMGSADVLLENDILSFQVGETPFDEKGELYSAMWTGSHGHFNSLWSVNYAHNHNIDNQWLISLGNKVSICSNLDFFFDWTDRLDGGLFKDFTIVPKIEYSPATWFRTRLEGSYDKLIYGKVLNGGIQLEFFPFASMADKFRFHIAYNHRYCELESEPVKMSDKLDCLNIGITYKLGAQYRSRK